MNGTCFLCETPKHIIKTLHMFVIKHVIDIFVYVLIYTHIGFKKAVFYFFFSLNAYYVGRKYKHSWKRETDA